MAWVDAPPGAGRGDAWRASMRCLAWVVVMPGAIKREASARDTEDIPSGLARHCDRIRVVAVVFARYAIVGDPGAVMIVISH